MMNQSTFRNIQRARNSKAKRTIHVEFQGNGYDLDMLPGDDILTNLTFACDEAGVTLPDKNSRIKVDGENHYYHSEVLGFVSMKLSDDEVARQYNQALKSKGEKIMENKHVQQAGGFAKDFGSSFMKGMGFAKKKGQQSKSPEGRARIGAESGSAIDKQMTDAKKARADMLRAGRRLKAEWQDRTISKKALLDMVAMHEGRVQELEQELNMPMMDTDELLEMVDEVKADIFDRMSREERIEENVNTKEDLDLELIQKLADRKQKYRDTLKELRGQKQEEAPATETTIDQTTRNGRKHFVRRKVKQEEARQ